MRFHMHYRREKPLRDRIFSHTASTELSKKRSGIKHFHPEGVENITTKIARYMPAWISYGCGLLVAGTAETYKA